MNLLKCWIQNRLKPLFYEHHFSFACVMILSSLALWVFIPAFQDIRLLGAALASSASLSYFAQQNHQNEAEFFKELFANFNRAYDDLNEKLNKIRAKPEKSKLSPSEVETLFNYFNLCGEEYLYFRKGFIYPEVWQAWLNGMRIFYRSERIKTLWDTELETRSYYGLSSAILRGGECPGCCNEPLCGIQGN